MLSTNITYITLIFGQKILITLKKSRKINAVWTTLEMATTLTHRPSQAKTDARNLRVLDVQWGFDVCFVCETDVSILFRLWWLQQ